MIREGCEHAAAIDVIDSEEVFEAMIQSGVTIDSISANTFCLTVKSSTIASMIRSHVAKSINEEENLIFEMISVERSAVYFPFSTNFEKVAFNPASAFCKTVELVSKRMVVCPAVAAT